MYIYISKHSQIIRIKQNQEIKSKRNRHQFWEIRIDDIILVQS